MLNPQTWSLPAAVDAAVRSTLRDWTEQGKVGRLWARDPSLWTGADEGAWLGWLGIVDDQLARVDHLRQVAGAARDAGFTHVLLLGMGGSSLCPEVLRMTFGTLPGWPELLVLDSTDPAQVRAAEARVDLGRTLFVVSSKSGTTLEPNIFKQYFFERARQAVGADKAGDHFMAITDPGSKLEQVARADGFRHVFFGLPSIGGRYSALSDFGMAPAALMGLDVERLLEARPDDGARLCRRRAPPRRTPARRWGWSWACLAAHGRDKVTLVASPGLHDLGAWLEQLLAESTGKGGKGLIPVDREPLGSPDAYGEDRLFVYVRLQSAPDAVQDRAMAELERAGHAGGPDRGAGPLPHRRGVLPLGDRDGRRRRRARDPPVRPARRRGQQGGDAAADGRVRAHRPPARRGAHRGGRGDPALRRRVERPGAGGERADALRPSARAPRAAPARRLRRRSSPTSR